MNISHMQNSIASIDFKEQSVDIGKRIKELKLKYKHISNEVRNQIVTRFLVDGDKLIDVS